jgi:biopolymer transport protein ExbD
MVQSIDAFLQKVFDRKNINSTAITVAQDGSGNYKTVQDALNAVPANNKSSLSFISGTGLL